MPYILFRQDLHNKSLCWFNVSGNAITEIALFYQNGYINRKHITIDKYTNKMQVLLINKKDHALQQGKTYNLYLIKGSAGNLNIDLVFDKKQYVAPWFRFNINQIKSPVTNNTWFELYGSLMYMPQLIDSDVEYDVEKHLNLYDENDEYNYYLAKDHYYEQDGDLEYDYEYDLDMDSTMELNNGLDTTGLDTGIDNELDNELIPYVEI